MENWGVDVTNLLIIPSKEIFSGIDKLRTAVELKLRREGIRILEEEIVVMGRFYTLRVSVKEEAKLRRDPSNTVFGVTWEKEVILGIYKNLDSIDSEISEILDEFLNDWYKANPKK